MFAIYKADAKGNYTICWARAACPRLCPRRRVCYFAGTLANGLVWIVVLGSGVVYDPSQSAHAIQQIQQFNQQVYKAEQQIQKAEQIYTTALQTRNIVRPAPAVMIRKFSSRKFTAQDLISRETLTQELAEYLSDQVEGRKTILISGGTGTGKTTLLNILAHSIPNHERIVTIEDIAELCIHKPNVVATECQTDTHKAPVSFDDVLKSSLRWRTDRIILGEVRGAEARTLLDSFNTGHSGSLATVHANSARKALRRFANLVMRSHQQARIEDVEAEIGEAVDLVIHMRDAIRRVD